ncbi:MAG: hypothetical protein B0D88_02725 [Candidatus Sedimenticola endophacoides]|nr:MAG: hypothetical protein B0D89_05300 [Candidatus Sedimenticola endophacoides]OQX44312.1 MAG: hypothetical protein B0D88_02725 [Candidatus Sedimenticola endophacoides]PUE03220.1 MAG: hypothetical protein C3L25_08715 [Candidatus Sedimenticola endophacoides]
MSGCASHSHEIQAAHVSSIGYKALVCEELHGEALKSINRVYELMGILDDRAENDEAAMGIGMILFWPALFALEGNDGPETAEYSRLKGEINAIEEVSAVKGCDKVLASVGEYRDKEFEIRQARAKQKAELQKSNNMNF